MWKQSTVPGLQNSVTDSIVYRTVVLSIETWHLYFVNTVGTQVTIISQPPNSQAVCQLFREISGQCSVGQMQSTVLPLN